MEKVIIYSTPAEIAEALKLFLKDYAPKLQEPVFENEKMTVAEGSHYIGVRNRTFCTLIDTGFFPVHGDGEKRYVLKSELDQACKDLL